MYLVHHGWLQPAVIISAVATELLAAVDLCQNSAFAGRGYRWEQICSRRMPASRGKRATECMVGRRGCQIG